MESSILTANHRANGAREGYRIELVRRVDELMGRPMQCMHLLLQQLLGMMHALHELMQQLLGMMHALHELLGS